MGAEAKTVADYAKSATIYHVKRRKGEYPSTWKLYPKKDVQVSNHCFIVKLKCFGKDLYLINASKFRETCPNSYATFFNSVNSYNSMISDLTETIKEQKSIVEKCFDCEILQPYKTGATVNDISQLPHSLDSQNAVAEIRRLFFLELELEMAIFLRTNIYAKNELFDCIDNFYNSRDPAFKFITKNDVLQTYMALFSDIISQS
uniref:Uncharacterized protein n=1 Tax=Panagrolaimus sp. PS1159 TaxID=55785 RepID=A0AC35FEW9_9BILA